VRLWGDAAEFWSKNPGGPEIAAWYSKENGDYYWFPDAQDPGVGYSYVSSDQGLTDPYTGMQINGVQQFIPNGTEQYLNLEAEAREHFSKAGNFLNPFELSRAALSIEKGGFDIKNRSDLVFGRGSRKYTLVNSVPRQNQDWGNMLFGYYGNKAGFPLSMLRMGGGVTQILQGHSSWSFWTSNWDEPRDQFYILAGYRGAE
jgi:hypothetical protein